MADIQDPMGISGYIKACGSNAKLTEALSKLNTALTRAEKAVNSREKDLDECFYYWNLFFNKEFPAR